MASAPLPLPPTRRRVVRLTVRSAYAWIAFLMCAIGLAFSTAALAAGVTSIDILAMVFAMGALAALLALVVWYLLQLRPPSS